MALPPGYTEVLVTDTATAERWERTFERLGVEVEVVETTGDDARRGEWQIGASEKDLCRAETLVQAVAAGRVQLPGEPVLRSKGFRILALCGVLLLIALLVLVFVLGRGG